MPSLLAVILVVSCVGLLDAAPMGMPLGLLMRQNNGAAGGVGTGGVAGVGAGANGQMEQQCSTMQQSCSQAACSSNNNQQNSQEGAGGLLGLGGLLGNTNVSPNVCPSICLQCINLNLINLGR